MDDLTPLPAWRQKLAAARVAWRRSKDRRARARQAFKKQVAKALTLAISVLGATLIAFGAYSIYAPSGYIVGGILCWVVLWSHEQDKGGRE